MSRLPIQWLGSAIFFSWMQNDSELNYFFVCFFFVRCGWEDEVDVNERRKKQFLAFGNPYNGTSLWPRKSSAAKGSSAAPSGGPRRSHRKGVKSSLWKVQSDDRRWLGLTPSPLAAIPQLASQFRSLARVQVCAAEKKLRKHCNITTAANTFSAPKKNTSRKEQEAARSSRV